MHISKKNKKIALIIWILFFIIIISFYIYDRQVFQNILSFAFSHSYYLGLFLFLLAGCLRGFTFIPSTFLIIIGLLFFKQNILFILVMAGILVSSTSVYYFTKSLKIAKKIEGRYPKKIIQIKRLLNKNELLIIIGLSFFPLFPTDLICYVCGSLNINYRKFILGILIGEGIACSFYIYLGVHFISLLKTII